MVRHDADGFAQPQPFDKFLHRTGLGRQAMPNRRLPLDIAALEKLLPGAVAAAHTWFKERRNAFEEDINAKLNKALAELEELKRRKLRQLEQRLELSNLAEPLKRARHQSGQQDMEAIFNEYLQWIEDVMTTEDRPWVQVVAALVGNESS